jgi:hypothetical protein
VRIVEHKDANTKDAPLMKPIQDCWLPTARTALVVAAKNDNAQASIT